MLLLVNICLYSTMGAAAEVPTDEQLLELEQQIKQQEAEQEKARQRAAEEARRKAEEQKLMEERARLEEEKRQLEAERKRQEQERQQAEHDKKQKGNEQKEKFNSYISAAEIALKDRDRDTAIDNFEQALAIYPDDAAAKQGLANAKNLKDKVCYDVLGEWSWNNGEATLILKEGGSLEYRYWGTHSGQWQCSNPANRQVHVRITALGFTQEWDPTLSQDNTCLGMKLALVGPECLYRPGKNTSSGDSNEKRKPFNPVLGR